MRLNRNELNKIQETLDKFPDVESFEIIEEGNNGIGSVLSIKFNHKVNDVVATIQVEIAGVESW